MAAPSHDPVRRPESVDDQFSGVHLSQVPRIPAQSSQEPVRELLQSAVARIEARLTTFERDVMTRLEACDEVNRMAIRVIGAMVKPKDDRAQFTVQLLPFDSIYTGAFYNRVYGTVFVSTFKQAFAVCWDEVTSSYDFDAVLEQAEDILHALVFRRLPSEKTTEVLLKSDTYLRGHEFRRGLCVTMITTAQSNPSVGAEDVVTSEGTETVRRPKWLERGYLSKQFIDSAVHRLGKESIRMTASRRRPTAGGSGALWEESVERDLLGEEIVRRLLQRHVQQLNKSRESVRADFFTRFGFLWHGSFSPVFLVEPSGHFRPELDSIPLAFTLRDKNSVPIIGKNLATWKDITSKYRTEMELVVRYEVSVHERRPFKRDGVKKEVVRRINILIVALSFCTKFNMCEKADDFFALHTATFKVVFAVACVFREMFLSFRREGYGLPTSEREEPRDSNERSIRTLILDLVPSLARTRTGMLSDSVLNITESQFNDIATDLEPDAPVPENSSLFIGQEDDDGEDEEEGNNRDEEVLAMRDVNFRV